MITHNGLKPIPALVAAALLGTLSLNANAGKIIEKELDAEIDRHAPDEEIQVIVTMKDKVNAALFRDGDKRLRQEKLVKALKSKSDQTQRPLKTHLKNRGARQMKDLWVINGVAVTIRADAIRELEKLPGIESIRQDYVLQAPAVTYGSGSAPEWNLNAVHASDLWALGYDGTGVVVASMDTGVDVNHPDLSGKWRGGGNSWFDPHGEHATPYDALGHGTQTMGIMVGGSSGGTAIGMAPGAKWIAVKVFNDAGQATSSDIHLSFQWLLDPDGNPNTADAPDVVNASWGLPGTVNQCVLEFANDIHALKQAGIDIVFAAGNEGSMPQTSVSPANNPEGFASGAVDSTLAIANFSSRGTSACDGGIYPQLTAPGVDINTADLSFGGLPLYAVVSGTSYAAPHTAGTMALLLSAFPNASVADLESALKQSAHDLGITGADNSYGYGLTDALAAYNQLLSGQPPSSNHVPAITSTPITSATQGQPYDDIVIASDPDGDALTYALDSGPIGMSIAATSGRLSWLPTNSQVGANNVVVRATDTGGLYATQSFTINVANVNDPPTTANDAYSVIGGTTLTVAAPGVLGNDSDPDGDALTALLVSGTTNGSLVLNANGSFSYTPAAGYTGTDSFGYAASDGLLSGNTATVTINVTANKAPVAVNDSATTRRNTAATIAVLANDYDPDGSLNPGSIAIVAKPNKGGSVTINSTGTISYTPKRDFTGKETFAYTVKDALGTVSNKATVTVNVTR